ncbi:hypothetical protein ACFWAY_43095 [Rhodococcus sp. NPDC059968]|uniref:hypothetical protein n=1 Tax=Rhodococcus sp. NPDC059968 TaxID=3347017 RepID=UPI00366F5702
MHRREFFIGTILLIRGRLEVGLPADHALSLSPARACSALREDMAARTRVGYALKTLLADTETARQALEFASVLAQTSTAPLVLQIPAPTVWLATTHEACGAGTAGDIDVDDAENMSVYVADWLRGLANLPIVALLLAASWPASTYLKRS